MNKYEDYLSWGRYPRLYPKGVINFHWINEQLGMEDINGTILPYAYGKSYGDSCLNDNGTLIDTKRLNHIVSFDRKNSILKCEAGITIDKILKLIVPENYFLPVTPGTKHISIGGAIANDVHGKNHHIAGTFGCYINELELLRSDGEKIICNNEQNKEFFSATIGGMGLTGIITKAEFKLKKIQSQYIDTEYIKFDNIDEFFEINKESEANFEYTVAWIDCSFKYGSNTRGIYIRGNHIDTKPDKWNSKQEMMIPVPFELSLINLFTINAFNTLYYNMQISKLARKLTHYNSFFYPLDCVTDWYKAYGKKGFLQYQFVIPFENGKFALSEILKVIYESGKKSFMTVLKTFGDIKSPGLMSFPRKGITLAIDFSMDGPDTFKLLDELDEIVRSVGGGLYPAKDARMKPEDFKRFYPQWVNFAKFIDPKFSSSFWRRVTK